MHNHILSDQSANTTLDRRVPVRPGHGVPIPNVGNPRESPSEDLRCSPAKSACRRCVRSQPLQRCESREWFQNCQGRFCPCTTSTTNQHRLLSCTIIYYHVVIYDLLLRLCIPKHIACENWAQHGWTVQAFKQRRCLSMITEDVPAAGTQRPSQPSREDPVPKARALGVFDICQFLRLWRMILTFWTVRHSPTKLESFHPIPPAKMYTILQIWCLRISHKSAGQRCVAAPSPSWYLMFVQATQADWVSKIQKKLTTIWCWKYQV